MPAVQARMRPAAAALRLRLTDRVYRRALRQSVRADTVLYESFFGKGMVCNPEAVFRELWHSDAHQHLQHVWVLRDGKQPPAQYRDPKRLRVVDYRSTGYFRTLATAGTLVNNVTFGPEFSKRPEQTYLNTWHGTPLKRMGYAVPDGAETSANMVRNFLAADFLCSGSAFMTQQMYADDFRLEGLFPGTVLESGQPRIDQQLAPGAQDRARELIRRFAPAADQRILLVAPTWRGASTAAADHPGADLHELLSAVDRALPSDWQAVLKVHQSVYSAARRDSRLAGRLLPDSVSANALLAGADALLTDYSSIFFDYLCLDRPILFHTPDLGEYRRDRGLYGIAEELPGPVTHGLAELQESVRQLALGADPRAARRRQWRRTYAPHDDGSAGRRVIQALFDGDDTRAARVLKRGGAKGARSALLVVDRIDGDLQGLVSTLLADDLDLEVSVSYSKGDGQLIEPRARPLLRVRSAGHRGEHRWRQLFGGARFDVAVDLSGDWGGIGSAPGTATAHRWVAVDSDVDLASLGPRLRSD